MGNDLERSPGSLQPSWLSETLKTLSDEVMRGCACARWESIGDEGRDIYDQFVSAARTRRGRRERAQDVVARLVNPNAQLGSLSAGG